VIPARIVVPDSDLEFPAHIVALNLDVLDHGRVGYCRHGQAKGESGYKNQFHAFRLI
jgi:hypothetical protein